MEFVRQKFFWILISLISLLVWVLRWIPESFIRFYNIVFISWDYYPRILVRGSMYTVAAIGMISRLIAVLLAIWYIYRIWRINNYSFSTRKILALAIGLEGVYFASSIPSILYLFALGSTRNSVFYSMFGIGYLLQVILTFPFLLILALKLYKFSSPSFSSMKLVGITFVGYIVALWANSVFHWLGLLSTQGPSFLFGEANSILAWNALILMTLAIIFSIIAGFYLSKNRVTKWMGLALTLVGFHFLIYLIYHLLTGSLTAVWLTDIWAVGFVGLGISTIITKNSVHLPEDASSME
ncbi:hypothetical protein AC477_01935 [miscellaneous Crenarchaeota group-1 archaeon SG8-32-1]|uniref:Uncharacterized protein n=1 Tax=miscellaneous Crenarchaeota group-1 archaeon SG8-32-1 TaxID=1685124 RepID=A0A0M0BWY2_9ARCH|nr:MAG: hypothetical protein AC477_01935 [miscellaneous Crenarchaeota group-1 archaeon SG8-32-1]